LISPCVLLSFWFISCIDYHLKLVWVSYVALLLVLPLWLPFLIWLLPSRNYLCAMIVENLLILDDFTRWCFISPLNFCCAFVNCAFAFYNLFYLIVQLMSFCVCWILIYNITKENLWHASRNQLKLLLIIMWN